MWPCAFHCRRCNRKFGRVQIASGLARDELASADCGARHMLRHVTALPALTSKRRWLRQPSPSPSLAPGSQAIRSWRKSSRTPPRAPRPRPTASRSQGAQECPFPAAPSCSNCAAERVRSNWRPSEFTGCPSLSYATSAISSRAVRAPSALSQKSDLRAALPGPQHNG